jgi:hypothetical protein
MPPLPSDLRIGTRGAVMPESVSIDFCLSLRAKRGNLKHRPSVVAGCVGTSWPAMTMKIHV